jgi:hypothetical protein
MTSGQPERTCLSVKKALACFSRVDIFVVQALDQDNGQITFILYFYTQLKTPWIKQPLSTSISREVDLNINAKIKEALMWKSLKNTLKQVLY